MHVFISSIKNLILLFHLVWIRVNTSDNRQISAIIFSKDRPMQLDALLRSLAQDTRGIEKIYVLYRVSDKDFDRAYDDLVEYFNHVSFIRESSFRDQLITLLAGLNTSRLIFFVDDIIFVDKVDFENLKSINLRRFVFSLRHGISLKYSYMVSRPQSLPPYYTIESFIMWKWFKGDRVWGYPLSVDGHLYLTQEILTMAKLISFKAPNTFEGNLQRFTRLYKRMKDGMAFQYPKIVNVPVNRVQNEVQNRCGEIHQKELLKLWNEGKRINIDRFLGHRPVSAHEEIPLVFEER